VLSPRSTRIRYKGRIVQEPDPKPQPLDHLVRFGKASDTAIITKAESIDFAMLDHMVGRLAFALRAVGLARGDRVASWLNKTAEACILPLATARAGLIHVPINPALKHGQVAHILSDSGAKLLITGEGRSAALESGDLPQGCRVWNEDRAAEARLTGEALPRSDEDTDSLCAILYTSGSTGKPKGVMLSHANLWLGAVSVAHYLKLAADDRTLCVLPLSFDYGQNQLLSTWRAGGCAIPLDYLSGRDVVRAVDRHQITTLAGVPPLWVQLVEVDWPESAKSIRRLTNSGGALTPPLVRKLRDIHPQADLYPMYGLTEAFRSTFLDPAQVDTHPTSIGRAIPFAEVMIVKPDGTEAKANELGELVHAGPLVAQGYWQDSERTALRFKPAPGGSHYGGTAVWSGDKARRDVDGLLYFVGRDDEMIKTSGNRVSPAEIEEVAVTSGVTNEAVAFGLPDPRLGQAIILIVRGNAEHDAHLKTYFKQELPAFMQPTIIQWRDDLPRNPNGKLDRVTLRAELVAQGVSS
jgi:acyl-CoA ligase (AMP-forming) (exosortase A-associated)